jgi:hypothetical protein
MHDLRNSTALCIKGRSFRVPLQQALSSTARDSKLLDSDYTMNFFHFHKRNKNYTNPITTCLSCYKKIRQKTRLEIITEKALLVIGVFGVGNLIYISMGNQQLINIEIFTYFMITATIISGIIWTIIPLKQYKQLDKTSNDFKAEKKLIINALISSVILLSIFSFLFYTAIEFFTIGETVLDETVKVITV